MARVSETPQRGFRYQERSREQVQRRANARGGDFDSIFKPQYKMYKVKDGKNLIRILPPTFDNADHYGFDLWINYNVGVDNQSYLSLSKMKGEKDPLLEARRQAEREGDKKTAKALQARQRILMWVIDRTDEDEGPQLFSCPFTLDKAILNLSTDPDSGAVIKLDHPEEGCDVRFFKEGTGLKTDYDASKIRILGQSPLHEDPAVEDAWLEYIMDNPLPDCVQYYDYDHINSVFGGQIGSRDSDGDGEDSERGRTTAPLRRVGRPIEQDPEPHIDERAVRKRVVDSEGEEDMVQSVRRPGNDQSGSSEEDGKPKEAPARTSLRDRLRERRQSPLRAAAGADED